MFDCIVTKSDYLSTFSNKKLGMHSLNKYHNLFPIYPSSEFAGLVADITGDGYLGSRMIQFISKNKIDVQRFGRLIKKLFWIGYKIRKSPSNQNVWECVICSSALARIFRLSGVPVGSKVLSSFLVPDWVISGSIDIKRKYIQKLFDCEGSVSFRKRKRVVIRIKMHKSIELLDNHKDFLEQIRYMLGEFGIKTTNIFKADKNVRKDGIVTIGMAFEFYGTRKNLFSVINFYKKIGFGLPSKYEKLENALSVLSNK
jgi:intein/homing endonuclease